MSNEGQSNQRVRKTTKKPYCCGEEICEYKQIVENMEKLIKDSNDLIPIYVEYFNPCCSNVNGNTNYRSHEEIIKLKLPIAKIFYIDKKNLDKVWGDDWNDAPSCCNSGLPYTDKNYKIYEQTICLGEPVPQLTERRNENAE